MDQEQRENQRGQGLINFLSNAQLAAQAATKAPLLLNPWVLGAAILIIIIIVFIIVLSGGGVGLTAPEENITPTPIAYYGLDYTIPFRDSSIVVIDLEKAKQLVKNEFPAAQLQYWDTLIEQSKNNSWGAWNPAFVLALWIEETGASHHTKKENGGGNIAPLSKGHLGCAPWEDQNIDESLRCLFRNFSNYNNSQFESFMRAYSNEKPTGPFLTNPNFPSRIKRYYTLLVPSGPGALKPIIANVSCPIPNGKITCASYGKPEPWGGFSSNCSPDDTGNGGHCNKNYVATVGICQKLTENNNLIRTAKSIDVQSPSGSKPFDPVYLPTIDGKNVNWIYKGSLFAGNGFGYMRLFQSEPTQSGIYSLHLIHVNNYTPVLETEKPYPSGTVVANLFNLGTNSHIHITIGLNIEDSISNLKDYSPLWRFTDREIHMCTQ